jgi:hypothetical protein
MTPEIVIDRLLKNSRRGFRPDDARVRGGKTWKLRLNAALSAAQFLKLRTVAGVEAVGSCTDD